MIYLQSNYHDTFRWSTHKLLRCESLNNFLIFVNFLIHFDDGMKYHTSKSILKGGEESGWHHCEDQTHGARGYQWYKKVL